MLGAETDTSPPKVARRKDADGQPNSSEDRDAAHDYTPFQLLSE